MVTPSCTFTAPLCQVLLARTEQAALPKTWPWDQPHTLCDQGKWQRVLGLLMPPCPCTPLPWGDVMAGRRRGTTGGDPRAAQPCWERDWDGFGNRDADGDVVTDVDVDGDRDRDGNKDADGDGITGVDADGE